MGEVSDLCPEKTGDWNMSDYSFIKEVIKEKPLNKKKLFTMFGVLTIAAVLFGGIAAFTFAYVLPYAQERIEAGRKPGKVEIITDDEELSEAATPTPTAQEQEVTPEVVEVPAEVGLADYKHIYEEMKTVSQEAQASIVTVIGIKNEVDYFNTSYDNKGQLSGVIIANNKKELLILTEYRVVEGVDRIQVTFANDKTVDAQFQKRDRNTGLTILKIPLETVDQDTMNAILEAPLGNSYGLNQGEPVIALGSPMGYSDSIAFGAVTSVTNTISTLDTEYSLITTDILGSEDGSGILVNLDGEIVGMIVQDFSIQNNTVTALSISKIKKLIQTLSNNGELPYVGIKGQDVTEAIMKSLGTPQGVYIENMEPESPAVQAGMMSGDVIVKVGEAEVTTIAEYYSQLESCKIGEPVQITVMREGVEGYGEIVFDVIVQAL